MGPVQWVKGVSVALHCIATANKLALKIHSSPSVLTSMMINK